MLRFFLLILFNVLIFTFIYFISKKDEIHYKENRPLKENKKDSEYWWYNAPHYHIMSNGERFNIAEYVSYEDWKKLDQQHKIQLLYKIENRILSTKNKENEKYN